LIEPNNTKNSLNPDSFIAEVDSTIIIGALWRRKWIILTYALSCIILANFYVNHIAEPIYPATATVALKEGTPHVIIDIESIVSGGPITNIGINTELEILRSRDFVETLVDSLNLINQPAINKRLQERPFYNRLIAKILSHFNMAYEERPSFISPELVRSNVINSTLRAIKVSNTHETLVINITVNTTDPLLSVLMANKMAELYIENQVKAKQEALASATSFLSSRTSKLKQVFEDLKLELAEFSSNSKLITPKFLKTQEFQLGELRKRLSEIKGRIEEKVAIHKKLQILMKDKNLETLVSTANDFRLNRIISQYRKKLISFNELSKEIDLFMRRIETELEREKEQFLAVEESKDLLINQIAQQSQELIFFQQLERETEASRILYESFFTRLQEMSVQLGLETADGRLLSKAIQMNPSSPIKSKILSLATVIGLMMGASVVIFKELRFVSFRSTNELRFSCGYGVLASVPLIPAKKRKSVISYLKDKPNSEVSEAVRNLRTSIFMTDPDRAPKVIMLTSSAPGEGKTTLAFSLAQSMASLGKSVILIEADIRRGVHTVDIDRKNSVPLLNLLIGDNEFKDVNYFNQDLGFHILTGTKSNKNAADIFASQRFYDFLKELRGHYDHIIIDTPPILAVPDARIIGANSDANIYIVKWNETTRAQVYQGLDMLSGIGVGITGLVLNQIDSKKMKFFDYAGQYGHNANGSGYYDN
jgi:polysaccharide biosynthesis transport protein